MIIDIVGVRHISGKGDKGSYDYFKVGYTFAWPKGTEGAQGVQAGSCNISSAVFDLRTPHPGDRIMLDVDFKGRIQNASFID